MKILKYLFSFSIAFMMEMPLCAMNNLVITPAQLATMQANPGYKLVIVDTRGSDDFAREHIAGAVSKPYYEIASSGLSKDAELVLYCSGIGCQISGNSAAQLMQAGYTNVRALRMPH